MTASVPPVNAVVFDLGGVLIDWNPRYLYRRLFQGDETGMEHFLANVCTQAWNERQDAGRSAAEAENELLARFPQHTAYIRAYYRDFDYMLRGALEETVRVLEALDARGAALYALSNWSAETFPIARRRFPFLSRFRDIVVSGDLKIKKPDPRIFAHLISRNALTPAATLFIDDSPVNVEAARAAGWQAHNFTDAARLADELRARGLLA